MNKVTDGLTRLSVRFPRPSCREFPTPPLALLSAMHDDRMHGGMVAAQPVAHAVVLITMVYYRIVISPLQ
ncbi:hypothetical protein V6N13_128923 [Hibiscus sabdariffa]